MDWTIKLQTCFGCVDKKFGRHPADEQRARELRRQLHEEGITWSEVEVEIRKYLSDCINEHVVAEIHLARKTLYPKP